jgi:hypothetical protein
MDWVHEAMNHVHEPVHGPLRGPGGAARRRAAEGAHPLRRRSATLGERLAGSWGSPGGSCVAAKWPEGRGRRRWREDEVRRRKELAVVDET